MTDLAASNVTAVGGTNQTVGRSHDIWGTREVGLYRVTLTNSAPAGGFTFDPHTYGFQGVVGAVFFSKHILVANVALQRYGFIFDFVAKKIVPTDATDSYDDATGDDLSGIVLDVLVIGE